MLEEEMTNQELSQTRTPFLLRLFHSFYVDVLRLKAAVLLQSSHSVKRTVNKKADTILENPDHKEAAEVLDTLSYKLEEQALEAKRYGGILGESIYKEAQYIMAALADEIFLGLSTWTGRSYWEINLLEQRIFGTHVAGEKFFSNLNQFLTLNEPLRKDLGFLYLTALGLGFRGQFRGENDQGKILTYKEKIFFYLYQEKPSLKKEKEGNLFPDTVQTTITQPLIGKHLQEVRRWVLIFLAILATYMIVAYGVWYGATQTLQYSTNMILEDAAFAINQ